MLDRIASPERTHIVISTVAGVHGKKNPVPYAPLLTRLGQLWRRTNWSTRQASPESWRMCLSRSAPIWKQKRRWSRSATIQVMLDPLV